MKVLILIFAISVTFTSDIFAQKISNAEELKDFYTEYLSNIFSDNNKLDSVVTEYCTKDFHTAWNRDVNEIGLYDPLTNGICDDLVINSLSVKKENDSYVVSFKYLAWPDNSPMLESVIVYVNADGKISHTKRPSDGYMTPEE